MHADNSRMSTCNGLYSRCSHSYIYLNYFDAINYACFFNVRAQYFWCVCNVRPAVQALHTFILNEMHRILSPVCWFGRYLSIFEHFIISHHRKRWNELEHWTSCRQTWVYKRIVHDLPTALNMHRLRYHPWANTQHKTSYVQRKENNDLLSPLTIYPVSLFVTIFQFSPIADTLRSIIYCVDIQNTTSG